MLSDNDLKYQYIGRNIKTIIKNIKNNNYNYCGDHHAELKAILNYLLLLASENSEGYNGDMLEEFTKNVRNIILDDKEIDIVLNLEPRYILNFAINTMNSKLEDAIIATNDAYYIYNFALAVKGANISKLEDAIIATEDEEYIFYFARDVKGADIKKLSAGISATRNAEYIYNFAYLIEGADKEVLTDGIIASGDAEYIYIYALQIKGINIEKLTDGIIATGNAEYIYYFARDVEGANISKLEDAIIATGNAEYIYKFALNIKGANIEKLTDGIIATGNAKYIYLFAKDVKVASISKLEDAVIATGNAEYIYKFAKDIYGANIEKLEDAVIATDNAEYIYRFARDIKGANIKKLFYAIINTHDILNKKYITLFVKLLKHCNIEVNYSVYVNNAFTNENFSSVAKKTNLGSYIYELKLPVNIKKMFADYLFDNIDKDNNYLILRVYLKMLNKPVITKEEAEALDLEYAAALKEQEASPMKPQNPVLEIKRIVDSDNSKK